MGFQETESGIVRGFTQGFVGLVGVKLIGVQFVEG